MAAASEQCCRKSFGGIRRDACSINGISRRKVLRRRQIYSPELCGVRRTARVVKPRLFAVFREQPKSSTRCQQIRQQSGGLDLIEASISIVLEHGKEAWFDDACCSPNTAELWRINLSTPQNFSPSCLLEISQSLLSFSCK